MQQFDKTYNYRLMVKKILFGIVTLMVALIVLFISIFYKPDFTKKQLQEYISESSAFMLLDNGANMHYRDEGNRSGEVIVFIHGRFTSLHCWESVINNLKDKYRIISIDMLGHGLTGKYPENIYLREQQSDAIHMLLDELSIYRYSVVGNCFGGTVAIEMALKYSDEITSMTIINSEGIPLREDDHADELIEEEYFISPDNPAYNNLSLLHKFGSRIVGTSLIRSALWEITQSETIDVSDSIIDNYERLLRYSGNREAQVLMLRQELYQISGNKEYLLPQLNAINVPTLILHGNKDRRMPLWTSELFKKSIKNSELNIIEDAGHIPMIDKPEEVANKISEFVNTNSL